MIAKSVLVFLVISFVAGLSYAQARFPEVTNYSIPPYPPVARAVRATGVINVVIEVDRAGSVLSANAVDGHPLLRKSAEAASLKWTFSAVPGRHFLVLRFNYRLGNSKTDISASTGLYTIDVVPRPAIIDYSVSYSAK